MSASISRHQLFAPQISQRKQHSRIYVIVKACCNSEKQPGARGTWVGWGSLWRCDKVTIAWDNPLLVGLTRGIRHYWAPIEEWPSKKLAAKPSEICQPPIPNSIGPIHLSHSSSIRQKTSQFSKQVNSSKKHVSSYLVYHHQTHSPHG
jgi:hypothetical protein